VNGQKDFKTSHRTKEEFSVHPKAFVFFDKRTGTRRFEVKADPDGSMPVDQALSLLVAHCLMRRQIPSDFGVMVAAGEGLFNGLRQLAKKLIHTCPVIEASVRLTNREEGVLREVLQSFSNKEIGANLHLSVRTVKFHVSSLLSKFGVDKRARLILKGADLLSVVNVPGGLNTPQLVAGIELGIGPELRNSREKLMQLNVLERRSRR
jgi:DNA-binding CsgD family transcriptional regulator